jgi:hypothetical protein
MEILFTDLFSISDTSFVNCHQQIKCISMT